MLITKSYPLTGNAPEINIQALHNRFEYLCIFDSNTNANQNKYVQSSKIIAIGATEHFIAKQETNAIKELEIFLRKQNSWVFGYLSYDFKNDIEQLSSNNDDNLNFPCTHFFVPKVLIQINHDAVSFSYDDCTTSQEEAFEIIDFSFSKRTIADETIINNKEEIKSKISKVEYIKAVNALKHHIHIGDIYEVNFCQEFFAQNIDINPVTAFEKLNTLSQSPFAAFCRFNKHYALSASPERFIQKKGNKLISQPIKGTIKRSTNPVEDNALQHQLQTNTKERSENVMIVDLVRNDFSRIAKPGSVHVDELFGIYTFKQWHQMISTVSCEINENIGFAEIIKSTFPMGSMTGAPKVSSMKLIEKYEATKRGLYSGAIGYIAPNGDFDFNVVIRSILYNAENKYASFMVGSAITALAIAEDEYEECMLKAKAMFEVLKNSN